MLSGAGVVVVVVEVTHGGVAVGLGVVVVVVVGVTHGGVGVGVVVVVVGAEAQGGGFTSSLFEFWGSCGVSVELEPSA